jgi:hypothetical protein
MFFLPLPPAPNLLVVLAFNFASLASGSSWPTATSPRRSDTRGLHVCHADRFLQDTAHSSENCGNTTPYQLLLGCDHTSKLIPGLLGNVNLSSLTHSHVVKGAPMPTPSTGLHYMCSIPPFVFSSACTESGLSPALLPFHTTFYRKPLKCWSDFPSQGMGVGIW